MLGLRPVAGEDGLDRPITTGELNRPALELTGYFAAFRRERIQIFGNGELSYLAAHAHEPRLRDNLTRILADEVPCAIVTSGAEPPVEMRDRANAAGIPLLACRHSTTKLYKRLWEHLEPYFAPATTRHGVLIEVHDMGVLIEGKSSVGKSEVALELIRRGFHLVADDVVNIKCLNDSMLIGRGMELLPFHMEARGLGIVDVSQLFGAAAIRPEKRITMVITLVPWQNDTEYDRIGLTDETISILDVQIPHLTIPVTAGRSVGTLIEIAALNQKLKNMGIHTAHLLDRRLAAAMGAEQLSKGENRKQP
jgi:HPr kinase/phosphorylase